MSGWVIFLLAITAFVALMWANTRGAQRWPGFDWFEGIIAPKLGDSAHGFYKVLVVSVLIVAGVFIFGYAKVDKAESLAWFGDFVGGVIGPVLTFLTFVGLLVTIILQQNANREARTEAAKAELAFEKQLSSQKRESFESTFFQMLTLHNTIVNSMDIRRFKRSDGTTPGTITGRDCFKFFWDDLKKNYDFLYSRPPELRISMAYEAFWVEWKQDLGHYFRYLYNVVRFIDDSNVGHNRYMKLLRAQLSDYELAMLFYNCLTIKGEKFKHYVESYSLLDNLPTELLFDPSHEALFAASARSDKLSKMAVGDTVSSTATIGPAVRD
ncbi:putative phage abortive infection protein [Mesorhizobium loti]|uniref:putative phage abortive infection protein n=1 Tax=Rhizobium loti TaxID=381 RepID=UPI0006866385|nr:putative phage abortive infection protein [Mesorhizobium loti]